MTLEEIGKNLPALLGALMLAILFIQSGLDKVFDWKGNLEWLNGHLSKTFLGSFVPVLFATLPCRNCGGIFDAVGDNLFSRFGFACLIFYAAVLGSLSLLALFFGQRVAKDYPGAAVLVPYFILTLILIYLTNPYRKG